MFLYEDFLREIQFNRRYSHHTVSAYKRDLDYYLEFCKTGQPVEEFYSFLDQKKLSSRSQARVISCVRTYLKFLHQRGGSAKDIKKLLLPRARKKLPKLIRLTEFKAIWKACEGKSAGYNIRNQLILAFLYGLGCRVSELIAMNIQDFNEREAWIRVTGKGDRQRLLPLPAGLLALLQLYLSQARPFIGRASSSAYYQSKNSAQRKKARSSLRKDSSSSPLFFNNRARRPSRVDIWRWLKLWSLKAGFKETKNPHAFRHGFATGLLEKGADLSSIQKLLGHLSIQTTQIYTSVSSQRLKKAIEDFHPLSKLKEI